MDTLKIIVYRVEQFFINEKLGPKFIGELIPEKYYKYLTLKQKEKVSCTPYTQDYDLFGYGLIFYSQEIDFPDVIPDETYEEMKCRTLNDVDNCCP